MRVYDLIVAYNVRAKAVNPAGLLAINNYHHNDRNIRKKQSLKFVMDKSV